MYVFIWQSKYFKDLSSSMMEVSHISVCVGDTEKWFPFSPLYCAPVYVQMPFKGIFLKWLDIEING